MSFVTTETATVYKGGGRRFFTRYHAYRHAAKALLRDRMERDDYDALVSPPWIHTPEGGEESAEPTNTDGRGERWLRCVAGMIRYWQWKDGVTARPRKVPWVNGHGFDWSTKRKPKALRCEILAALGLPQNASLDDVKQQIANGSNERRHDG